jgi:hypothetical protein
MPAASGRCSSPTQRTSLRRLRPTAEDDAEAEDEFRWLMDGELESRCEACRCSSTPRPDRLTAEAGRLARALTDSALPSAPS